MALLDEMKVRVRVLSDLTDDEVQGEIDAALADMRLKGVKPYLLSAEDVHPLVKHAIALYVKAFYGYDNAERPQFVEAYNQTVTDLMNNDCDICLDVE